MKLVGDDRDGVTQRGRAERYSEGDCRERDDSESKTSVVRQFEHVPPFRDHSYRVSNPRTVHELQCTVHRVRGTT